MFPFGEEVKQVVQTDRSPKRVFILGYYSSAVHAKWLDAGGKQKVQALGVASEPYIFWRGEGVEEILAGITIPSNVGSLIPAEPQFNGPTGRTLDEKFLDPLGLTRDDVWLCDLCPYSRMNEGQESAIQKHYQPLISHYSLSEVSWKPTKNIQIEIDDDRREQILSELFESKADVIITLGNPSLKAFARFFGGKVGLSEYGKNPFSYGQWQKLSIRNRDLRLVPLVHPRQAAGDHLYSPEWRELHENWCEHFAPKLRASL